MHDIKSIKLNCIDDDDDITIAYDDSDNSRLRVEYVERERLVVEDGKLKKYYDENINIYGSVDSETVDEHIKEYPELEVESVSIEDGDGNELKIDTIDEFNNGVYAMRYQEEKNMHKSQFFSRVGYGGQVNFRLYSENHNYNDEIDDY